jgi:hypothetical protein
MAERPVKRLFPNPFYVLLLVASTLFVLTILGYLAVPSVLAQANEPGRDTAGSPGAVRLLDAFNRGAPMILAVECGVMIVSGLLAMATDRWFGAPKPKP